MMCFLFDKPESLIVYVCANNLTTNIKSFSNIKICKDKENLEKWCADTNCRLQSYCIQKSLSLINNDKLKKIIWALRNNTLHKEWSFPLRIYSVNVTDTQNALIIFLSAIAVMQVIGNVCFISDCSNLFDCKLKNFISEQIIIVYSQLNALCSSGKSVQIKYFKHHTFDVQSTNTEFMLMKTHQVLNRSRNCVNVRYCKNQEFLQFYHQFTIKI